jgi:hypothetical protein
VTTSYYNAPEPEGPGLTGILALVLAWAVPGLGHILLGQRARGLIFALTVHGLFAAGMLIGGVKAINPPDQPIWSYTQALTGWPMLVANRVEKASRRETDRLLREYDDARRDVADRQAFARGYFPQHALITYHPKVQDIGAVYCGIAGMLNLLVVFDVLLRITNSVREDPAAAAKKRRRSSLSTLAAQPPATPAPAPAVPAEGGAR